MKKVIGVNFKKGGKIYYFDPDGLNMETGIKVIVETSRGIEAGTVVLINKEVDETKLSNPLKAVERIADISDIKIIEQNKIKEEKAKSIFVDKVKEHKLNMKLADVEYTFDHSKVIFYFIAEGRVDFRTLVKSLASIFKTRIELRQIGVRDQAKMIGGLGICGKPFCCTTFLTEFHPVSIKMAKEQNLSLNPTKISGTCGRLMCCLKYEHAVYEELIKDTPKYGAIVETNDGRGRVIESDILKGILKVKLDSKDAVSPQVYNKCDVKLIKDGKIKINKEDMAKLLQLEK